MPSSQFRAAVIVSAAALGLAAFSMRHDLSGVVAPGRLSTENEQAEARRYGPASARLMKTEPKSERLAEAGRREGDGRPQFDDPGEFARILAEMKIPADRTVPEYEPGYQGRELSKALQKRSALAMSPSTLAWTSRGPGNVGGRARGIVVDPDDATNQTWFIGSVGGGVWKTTNGGATWNCITPNIPILSTSAIAMAPSNHNVLYVGTGESFYNVDAINGNGILKSTDRGVTWTQLASTVNNAAFNNVARIIIDPTNPNVVLAATTRGRYKEFLAPRSSIFKSADGGTTWTEVYASTTIGALGRVKKVLQLVADPSNFNNLYATVDQAGILKSTNRGDTWTFINTGITDFSGRFELAVSPVNPSRLFAAAQGASKSELWVSTNAGGSWSQTAETGSEPNWLGSQGWYDNTIVCHPTDVNVVYVGGVVLARISVSGTSRTTTFLDASVHVDNHGLQIINAPGGWRILNTSDGGVAVSTTTDAGWSQVIDGMVTTQFYGIDKRPGASAYVGGTQDNGTWQSPENPGDLTPWNFVIGGDGYEASWDFNDPMKLIGAYQYNGLMRSLDGGATWNAAITSVSPPGTIDNGSGNAPFITKIAKSQINTELLCAAGRQGVWRSTDFGGTWSLASISSTTWGAISSFHDVRISRADPNIVWGGARMDATGQIHKSTNGGVSFTPMPNYTTVTMGGISGLATHPTEPNTAYVLFSFAQRPKILKTTDGGATWHDITGFESSAISTNGFPDVAVYDLLVFSNNTSRLWAATEIGIVESLDGGATWTIAENGLPHVAVWFLTEVEDEVVAATHGRGVWSVTMPELIAGKTFSPLIDNLSQAPDGYLTADLNLRSVYDSTQVRVDAAQFTTLPTNTFRQAAVVRIPVVSAGTKTVMLRSWRGGISYDSVTRSANVFAPRAPVFTYQNDFEGPTGDFTGPSFRVGTQSGFTGKAIHSPHPYVDDTNASYLLTVPIRVAWSGANLEFDEEALVEPGDPGSVYGDPNFYDFVVVEGTKDGINWLPLAPGWDCRAYPEWVTAFNTNSPSPSLLRHRTINIRNTFAWNDTILVRFRLFADSGVNGWGWMIDNLAIQVGSQSAVGDESPRATLALEQNMPNPFRASTAIHFNLPRSETATLNVYDVQGRLIRTLVSGTQAAGPHSVAWDGRDDRGAEAANGIYFYHLVTSENTLKRKMVVVR